MKTIDDTSYNVTSAYYGVLSADKLVTVAQDSLALAKSHLDQVQAMLSSGVVTQGRPAPGRSAGGHSEVALTKARNNFELAKDTFNNVLGRAIGEPVELSDAPLSVIPALPDYQTLLKTAYDNRPDWKSFNYSKNIAEENLSLARPLLADDRFERPPATRSAIIPALIERQFLTVRAGAASWTLFDGLGIQNRINEAAANLEVQKANEDEIRNGVALDVHNAYLNLKSVIETIGSAKKRSFCRGKLQGLFSALCFRCRHQYRGDRRPGRFRPRPRPITWTPSSAWRSPKPASIKRPAARSSKGEK